MVYTNGLYHLIHWRGGGAVAEPAVLPEHGTGGRPVRAIEGVKGMPIQYERDTEPETPAPPVSDIPQWSVILDAPDYQTLIKPVSNANAREYEKKVNSVLKEVLRYRLTPEGLPDAAAILTYGPSFAQRAGQLADHDPNAAKILDMLTAPDSPWVMFAIAAIPFVGQLFRNHEAQIKAIPEKARKTRAERRAERAATPRAELRIPGTKRTVKVPFRIRLPLGVFRASTVEPVALANHVFGNPDVRKQLTKAYGIKFGENNNAPSA